MTQVKKFFYVVFSFATITLIVASILHYISWWVTVPVVLIPVAIKLLWKNFFSFLFNTYKYDKKNHIITEIRFCSVGETFFYAIPAISAFVTATLQHFGTISPQCASIILILGVIMGEYVVHTDFNNRQTTFLLFIIGGTCLALLGLQLGLDNYGIEFRPFLWIWDLIERSHLEATPRLQLAFGIVYGIISISSLIYGMCFNRYIIMQKMEGDRLGSPSLRHIDFMVGEEGSELYSKDTKIANTDTIEGLFGMSSLKFGALILKHVFFAGFLAWLWRWFFRQSNL